MALFRDDWKPQRQNGRIASFDTRESISRAVEEEKEKVRQQRLAQLSTRGKLQESFIGRTLQPVRNVINETIDSTARAGGRLLGKSGRAITGGNQQDLDAGEIIRLSQEARSKYPELDQELRGRSIQERMQALKMVGEGASLDDIRKSLEDIRQKRVKQTKQTAGDVALVGSFALPVGKGINVLRGGKAAAKTIAASSASGAVGGAGYQLSEDPEAGIADIAKTAALGGAVGGALPVVASGLSKLKVGREVDRISQYVDNEANPISDTARKQIQATIKEQGKYKLGTLQKITDVAKREFYDPLSKFSKLDRVYAKKAGTNIEKLAAQGRSLPELVNNARYHQEITKQFFDKKYGIKSGNKNYKVSFNDLIKKYGNDTPESQQFNNYLNNKFIVEVSDKNAGKVSKNLDIGGIKQAVKDYEKANPTAVIDAKAKKKLYDDVLDYAVDTKLVSKKDADFVKKTYEFYNPLVPVSPDDLIRPSIQGGMGFNVGRQGVLKDIKQIADRPLDISFEKDINLIDRSIGQSLKNKLDTELLRRQQEGLLEGATLKINPEITRTAKELRDLRSLLVKKGESTRGELGKKVGQLRVQNAYNAPLYKKTANATRKYLVNSLEDADAKASAKSLSDKQALDVFANITGDGDIEALRAQLIKKGGKSQALLDDIDDLKVHYQETSAQRQQIGKDLVDLRQDKSTGQNLLIGQKEGEKFAIEVPPDLANALSYMAPKGKKDFALKVLQAPANVQKSLYTGIFAPVFQAIQPLKNLGVMFTNARRLSPFGARAIGEAVRPSQEFKQELISRGFRPEVFTKSVSDAATSAEHIASQAGVVPKLKYTFSKNFFKSSGDFFRQLNRLGAFFGNRQRLQVARGAYQNALNRGMSKDEALNIATQASNEILGNFNRVSDLARAMEPVFLYSGATQAGIRPFFQAMRNRPVETSIKLGAMASGFAGFGSLAMGNDAGQKYFKDMYDNGQAYNVDNYLTYVAPWAKKDEKTGTWSGIYRTPIAPDYRPINKAILQEIYNFTNDKGVDPVIAAQGVFNFATGGMLGVTDKTGISLASPLKQNAVVKTGAALLGKDVQTGRDLPEQILPTTSGAGKRISELLGGKISANQVDAILRQGGLVGQTLTSESINPIESASKSFQRQFGGGVKGKSAAGQAFEAKQDLLKGVDEATRKAYEARHTYNRNQEGEIQFEDKDFYKGENAAQLLNNDKLYELEKKSAEIDNQKTGKPVNPVFTVPREQAKAVLLADLAEAVPGEGSDLRKATLYDQPWYEGFRAKEQLYFKEKKQWNKSQGYDTGPARNDGFPEQSDKVTRLQKRFNSLPQNDGPQGGNQARRIFLEKNPELSRYFDSTRLWKNRKRLELARKLGVDVPLLEGYDTNNIFSDSLGRPQSNIRDALGRRIR